MPSHMQHSDYGGSSELEVDREDMSGGYDGGGVDLKEIPGKVKNFFTEKIPGWIRANPKRVMLGVLILFVLLIIILFSTGVLGGFTNNVGVPNSHGAFDSLRSDKFSNMRSSFMGDRSAPHFSDVTNTVLRSEDREKEAVRALGKINQERLRRAAEDSNSTTPLPWEPFWKEWKATHPMESDGGRYNEEGFSDKFDQNQLVPY
jgi:hypothetical protein